jgi:hypothetical protein
MGNLLSRKHCTLKSAQEIETEALNSLKHPGDENYKPKE